jgi:hypothetical protein
VKSPYVDKVDFVSQKTPAASSYIAIAPSGTPGHSKQLADVSITKKGLDAMIVGTKSLGIALVELSET